MNKYKEQPEKGTIKRHDFEEWANGIIIGNKTKFHPYTRKDFKFDHKRT